LLSVSAEKEVVLKGFFDSDYRGCLDSGKSTTGYIFTVGVIAVSWMSRIQMCVAVSTTEAEYMAIAEASKELVWLKNFLEELDRAQTENVMYCDNQSAIHLVKNPVFYSQTKHITIRYHYIRELVSEETLSLKKILGAENPADMLTKALINRLRKLGFQQRLRQAVTCSLPAGQKLMEDGLDPYVNCLAVHPLKTQVISSGLIWGFGDIAAQSVTHLTAINKKTTNENSKELRMNWRRVATTSLFGMAFVGPVGHFWYEGLDRFLKTKLQYQPKSMRFVATKVALDGIIFGPVDLFVFFTYMGFATGKTVNQVKEDVKRDFLPALILEGGIWPIVQVANFRFIPVRYQLLYVNSFCLLDSCFLSWLEQQQDAAWKQMFKNLSLKEHKNQES
nr:protein Mpv17-like [Tanacetum cinerariifolium]